MHIEDATKNDNEAQVGADDAVDGARGADVGAGGEDELSRLRRALDEKEREASANRDRYVRAAADLENARKRLEREKADLVAYGNERLVAELIQVLDNMELALDHADTDNIESLREGLRHIHGRLLNVLEGAGLKAVSALGEPFDPTRHEAISHDVAPEHRPGSVVKEFQKGYIFKERLLRPARVSVAKDA